MNEKKRIIWVDYAKAIGMYLVILGHTMLRPPTQLLFSIIYSFHMPLFFFISGFLHKTNQKVNSFLQSTIKQLIIPFFFFNLLEIIPTLITNRNNIIDTIELFLKEMMEKILIGNPPVGPSWFILCLLWMKILLWSIDRIFKNKNMIILFTIGIILLDYLLIRYDGISSLKYFCIANALLSFPFYATAYVTKIHYEKIKIFLYKKDWLFIPIAIIFVISLCINDTVSLQSCNIGNNFFLMILCGFLGTFITIKLCSVIKKENIYIKILSTGCIIILCTHGFILNNTINKYTIFDLYSPSWFVFAILMSFIVMLIEIPIIKFFSRFFSWGIGGRKLN